MAVSTQTSKVVRLRRTPSSLLAKQAYCDHCGKPFHQKSDKQKFCTRSCRRKAYALIEAAKRRERRGVKTCHECKEDYVPRHKKQRFCSDKCARDYTTRRLYKSGTAHIVHPAKPGTRKCLAPDGNPDCAGSFFSQDKTKFVYCPSCREFFATATEEWDEEDWGVGDARGWR